ncbi:Oar-like outer membrane protein protein, OmpA family [Pseudoalteromonas luteoviolacea B = ATCC 29581]|nr:Oar-like outer membrane protein protein, OmpA family [Pseudoalteromonas luteoviolacea B = ATCC 29581]
MKNLRLSKVAGAMVLALGVTTSAFAADTSSAIRGKITTPTGAAASNVEITIVHEPTGTVSKVSTTEDGFFSAKGLRVGGPYKVLIDSDTFSDAELKDIYLELGETKRLNSQLEALQQIEKIEVAGYRIVQQAGGANSVFGADTIENTPSFNRDIKDIARLNPLASINGNGEMTIAGNNPRSNSLTVDGISQNDDFGLNYGGYPTQQPPVSLDSIEQISVDVSPFSAKKGNFGGGTINAVTKSGSNEFKFSMFAETSTPSLSGDSVRLDEITEGGRPVLDENKHRTYQVVEAKPIQTEQRYGFNVGGPLIKDELFFFVDYSNWSSELDLDYGFENSGAVNEFDVSKDLYDQFVSILDNTYGVKDGLGGNPEDTNQKLLAKVSWNINDQHRADFTYQWQDDQDAREFALGGSSVQLASNGYTYQTKFNNFATKLYSDWSDVFSTELGLSYKDVTNSSRTVSDFGQVTVRTDGFRSPEFVFGSDVYRHANYAENQNFVLDFDATYLLGEHELGFGMQYENLRLYNLFAPNSKGSYIFDNFDDFINGTVASFRGNYDFQYSNAFTGNVNDVAYDARRSTLALYLEDTFYLTDDLEITAGLRYERLSSDDKPALNEGFVATYGYSNQENLDGKDIILPRIGFKYYATDDLVVKGGIGRFQGGIPNVWYNDPFQKDGLTYVNAPQSAINEYFANNAADFRQAPAFLNDSLVQGAGSVSYVDPNFELPSTIRAQVGFEYEFGTELLGDGFKWEAELSYHKKENEVVWHNTSIRPVGVLADGERIVYESIYDGDRADNWDIMLTNAQDEGRSIIFSTALAKEWDNGLYSSISYAHQDIEEVQAGSSSQSSSNYKHSSMKSRNVDLVGRGFYETEHALKINLGYKHQFFEGYNTHFNLFFERRSGRPMSYTMGLYRDEQLGDFGSDLYSHSAYLAYIPTGADDPAVNWEESRISWEELETLLNKAGITERGQILDRNTATQPWVTSMDLSIKQDIPGFKAGHKGQIYFMIDNFANLLNKDWGIERKLRYSDQALYDLRDIDDQGRYVLERKFNGSDVRNYSEIVTASSSWQIKVGVNYKF